MAKSGGTDWITLLLIAGGAYVAYRIYEGYVQNQAYNSALGAGVQSSAGVLGGQPVTSSGQSLDSVLSTYIGAQLTGASQFQANAANAYLSYLQSQAGQGSGSGTSTSTGGSTGGATASGSPSLQEILHSIHAYNQQIASTKPGSLARKTSVEELNAVRHLGANLGYGQLVKLSSGYALQVGTQFH